MFKNYKIWFAIAGIFIVTGILLCTLMLSVNGFDISAFNTESERVKKEYKISRDSAINLTIETRDNDIILKKTKESEIKVTCYESEELTYDIINAELDKNLKISEKDNRKWYQKIDVNFGVQETPLIVEIPDKNWEKVKISTSSGDIKLFDFSSGDFSIETMSGNITAFDMNTTKLNIGASSGDINIKNYFITEELTIDTSSGETNISEGYANDMKIVSSSGDIRLSETSSIESRIETSSGNIIGRILNYNGTIKFIAESQSGDVFVPSTDKDGEKLFSAVTKSGDIMISYAE